MPGASDHQSSRSRLSDPGPQAVASGWSDLAGWALHPLESAALSRRTPNSVIAEDRPERLIGLTHRTKRPDHSITSSARARNWGGIVRRSAFAVSRLIVRSKFVGCSTGKSADVVPRRILST